VLLATEYVWLVLEHTVKGPEMVGFGRAFTVTAQLPFIATGVLQGAVPVARAVSVYVPTFNCCVPVPVATEKDTGVVPVPGTDARTLVPFISS